MNICSKCGSERFKLIDILCEEGIISVCEDCVNEEDILCNSKPRIDFSEDSNTRKSVYERLRIVAGLKNHKKIVKTEELELQEKELKELVENRVNLELNNSDVELDLVRNFHWIIMRARRLRKLTISELGKKIFEPEEILKKIESGEVKKPSFEIIRKLELFFGIQVLTDENRKKLESSFEKRISFDKVISQSLTIDDLREMKKKRDSEVFEDNNRETEIKIEKPEKIRKENFSDNLTQKDIDDLIFGRRN